MKKLKKLHQSHTVKNSLIYTSDFILQIVVLAAYAVLISRELGPASYGVFASIAALSIIGSMFAGWGCDQTLIKNVSANPDGFRQNLGHGLLLILLTYPVLLAVLYGAAYLVIPNNVVSSLSIVLFITVDLIFTKILFLTKASFAVFERAKNQLVINLVTTSTKLLFLLLALKVSDGFNLNQWAFWYFISGLLSASFALSYTIKHLGLPKFSGCTTEFVLGFQFSIEQASLASLKDLDKPIIVAMLGAEQGGHFAIAFRLVDAASAPVRGILYALYIKYFKVSYVSKKDSVALSLKVLPYLTVVSLIAAVLIYCLAWTIPILLGDQYQAAVVIVQQLCLYPLLFGLFGTSMDLLRTIGKQFARTVIVIASSVITLPILYLSLSQFGMLGASFSKLIVLAIFVVAGWLVVYKAKLTF
ncbi:oligosaccharide flippase family protein [Methylotenera mobilis]|uniref:Polysaccharide biosynthesis protein n=1 Tax=Methylotenera mobilis (strain JLW8 / ATCC BAA-1282 / DSM 17540) TaxID=583345 RepID=C6WXP6_METML|nr:oligosaccharide flippase family protein [Methylotenera mobilis]ACT48695.1 polysaccharide biosynthesis protein [Methylotenera mobilis JLW8]